MGGPLPFASRSTGVGERFGFAHGPALLHLRLPLVDSESRLSGSDHIGHPLPLIGQTIGITHTRA